MNEQDMVKKLKNDPAALRSVMQSADGRALLGMLSGGDTAALGRAAQQAAAGDMSALSAMPPAFSWALRWNKLRFDLRLLWG